MAMDSVLAAATSFFARTNISQSYTISTASRSGTPVPFTSGSSSTSISSSSNHAPTSSPSSSAATTAAPPTILIGLWKVQSAIHKVNNKKVSVWSFDKKGPDMERLSPLAKDRVLEVLKAEASALGRLRHPSILEMVEPLEETRGEITFATEPVLSSLELAIPGVGKYASLVELDEVEIQKGILQICKGLSFLHSSAQLIHSNLSPESIIINTSGDWKISGLGLTIPLLQTNGNPTRWEFPTFDGRVPSYVQRSFDYMAPEYAISEMLLTSSDMYSLGILIFCVHSKGIAPYRAHGSISGMREHVDVSMQSTGMLLKKRPPGMQHLDAELQTLITSLLGPHSSRPSPSTVPSQSFFSSLTISTLNFLDRSNFTSKTREEKISFMKGLTGVMGKFSEGLKRRKLLGSLLEEMKDISLLPYILPNIFLICANLSQLQFTTTVLPSLKPLFSMKESATMMTLLENLEMLKSKTDPGTFRSDCLPLVYNALESEHTVVQERALKVVPDLCETIDYAEVQGVLFPRVALVFKQTRVLSVKVATLETFLAMVKTLDQSSLTQKLVPLLSKIRTKEPAVMMVTLQVQEAMGFKVDREAVATLVLPQLWAMSMGPLLNLSQFQNFMSVIRKLGDRVEKEHDQFLRDSQRIEDRSSGRGDNGSANAPSLGGSVDFESLVGGKANGTLTIPGASGSGEAGHKGWDDDVWGSIFADDVSPQAKSPTTTVQTLSPPPQIAPPQVQSLPSTPQPPRDYSFPPPRPSTLGTHVKRSSTQRVASSLSTSTPTTAFSSFQTAPVAAPAQKPNYNISLAPSAPSQHQPMYASPPNQPPLMPFATSPPLGFAVSTPATPPVMGMNALLTPSKPANSWATSKPSKNDWGDFDPLA